MSDFLRRVRWYFKGYVVRPRRGGGVQRRRAVMFDVIVEYPFS